MPRFSLHCPNPWWECPLNSVPPSCLQGVLVPSGAAPLHAHGRAGGPGAAGWYPQPGRTAAALPRAANDERTLFDALIARAGRDPAGFDFAVQPIRQSAELGLHADLMVTVTCRAVRISRSYFSGAQDAAWLADLANDLQAGVYGA